MIPYVMKPGDLFRRDGFEYLVLETVNNHYLTLSWFKGRNPQYETMLIDVDFINRHYYFYIGAYAKIVRGRKRAKRYNEYRYFAVYLPRHKEPFIIAGCRRWRGFDAAIKWYQHKRYPARKRDASVKIIRDLKMKCRSVKWLPKTKRKGAR